MPRQLLLLEDDDDRIKRFRRVLAEIDPDVKVVVWRNAYTMIAEAQPHLRDACVRRPQPRHTGTQPTHLHCDVAVDRPRAYCAAYHHAVTRRRYDESAACVGPHQITALTLSGPQCLAHGGFRGVTMGAT